MGVLIHHALYICLHSENMLKARAYLYSSFAIKENLTATDIVVRKALLMKVVKRSEYLFGQMLKNALR